MLNMAHDYSMKNWHKIIESAENIKGASGYVGAGRIYNACYFISSNYS